MSVLDEVTDLKSRGISDLQIINKLEEEGISPKEINDALNRAKIKSAVSSGQGATPEGMQPSIMSPEDEVQDYSPTADIEDEAGLLPPIPSETRMKLGYSPKVQEMQNQYYQEPYSPSPQYSEYMPQETSYSQNYTDTDTMIEISEQVFAEKMKDVLKIIEEVVEFKTLAETKLENFSERLKRLESQIDKLQSAILEKVGDYGRGLDTVKREMEMMQDSFGKVVSTLADKSEHKHHSHHHTAHSPQHQTQHRTQHESHSHPSQTVHKIEKKTTVIHKSHKGRKKKK